MKSYPRAAAWQLKIKHIVCGSAVGLTTHRCKNSSPTRASACRWAIAAVAESNVVTTSPGEDSMKTARTACSEVWTGSVVSSFWCTSRPLLRIVGHAINMAPAIYGASLLNGATHLARHAHSHQVHHRLSPGAISMTPCHMTHSQASDRTARATKTSPSVGCVLLLAVPRVMMLLPQKRPVGERRVASVRAATRQKSGLPGPLLVANRAQIRLRKSDKQRRINMQACRKLTPIGVGQRGGH